MRTLSALTRASGPVLVALALTLSSCTGPAGPGRPDVLPEPDGGSMCFAAFEFNKPVEDSVVLDGQACPNVDAPCGANTTDWPVALDLPDTDYDGYIEVNTKVAHYRIAPPVPPTESDLYVAFEAEQADVNDNVTVTVALNPSGTDTDNRAVVIQPFPGVPPNGAAVGLNTAVVTGYQWNGAAWVNWAIPAGAVDVRAAHEVPNQYWGVEVRVHLPDVGITVDDFYMATYWRSNAPVLGPSVAENWSPAEAYPAIPSSLPDEDPTTWRRYSFGTDCMPDLYINSAWNTCADIYINAEDENAKRIAINNVNEFHARVHGDDDPGAPTADGVLVYMDIGHLGNGQAPYAMNYPHTDATINFNGATRSLDAAMPEPPTPFSVAAQTTNDDVRVEWRPSDEAPNPFADGEHVCVEAYVYFKDDPNFDNNFGQCNMQFVDEVQGRLMFAAGFGFWWPFDMELTQMLLVPTVVNSASRVGDWRVDLRARGMERTNVGWILGDVPKEEGAEVELRYSAPANAFEPPDEKEFLGVGGPLRLMTREVYGERPLLVVKSFIPVQGRDPKTGPYTVAFPGSYVGIGLEQ